MHLNLMHRVVAALTIALAGILSAPHPAQAYQIDCAILLCLAGGFPPSEPCTRARAEMIRRITPWPVEPPLQLWRCPMRADFVLPDATESVVTEAAASRSRQGRSVASTDPGAQIWKAFGETVTDYVMAIKVYDLTYHRHRNRDGDCLEWGRLRLGSYDEDWDFSWRRAPHSASPDWLFSTTHTSCSSARFRGIGMEWRDHEGKQGTEVVRY